MIDRSAAAAGTTGRQLRAMDVVARFTLLCAAANRLPYWWATSPSITGLQLKMIAEISHIYGVEFDQDLARPMIASVAGGFFNLVISENPWSRMVKAWMLAIPVVGVPLRFGMGPAAVAAYTYTMGRAFVRLYESSGTYHDFTAALFRAELSRMLGFEPPHAANREALKAAAS